MYEKPRAGDASLSRCSKNPRNRAFNRVVEICVREDNIRRLSAELQRYALEVFRCGFVDLATADLTARKCDLAHERVRDQWLAGLAAVTCDRIDDTFGEACLLEQPHELEN